MSGSIRKSILMALLGSSMLFATDFSSYRGLKFGMKLPVAAERAGRADSDARVVHQRPALIQELRWRALSTSLATPAKADPVQDGSLYFYNGQLFRIVVNYDRYRIEGMTSQDMLEAISVTYGIATQPGGEIPFHSNYGEMAAVIARWEDADYSWNLVRTGDQTSFAMVLYSKRLDLLAEAASVEAVRLDAVEAPQRELDAVKKKLEAEHAAVEKARLANKPNFQP